MRKTDSVAVLMADEVPEEALRSARGEVVRAVELHVAVRREEVELEDAGASGEKHHATGGSGAADPALLSSVSWAFPASPIARAPARTTPIVSQRETVMGVAFSPGQENRLRRPDNSDRRHCK